ncbi:HNH endonuclease [Labilithrix luteola]|nr:HNH endonuclease signature motif containing protein [Labilithrix luteola]
MPRLLATLSNEAILVDLRSFVGVERQSLARMIVYLVEIEERRLHLELACSSMFDFCTRRLGFSEGEAFRRLTAARLVRRLPVLLDAIASGQIHLSSLVLLRDALTEENVDEIVAAASGKTKREVEELVARMAPKPDVRASIRKLPERRPSSSAASSQEPFTTASQSSPPQLKALAERRYRVQLTANEALRDKLELARALMSHQNPSGDLATIVERAVELLIEKLSKEKLGTSSRARGRKPSAKHGYVTRAARREAFERDGMQCSFVGENGGRCPARSFLELDHVTPRALGGSGEAENLRVFCRAHNHDAAERVFGRAHVEARVRTRRKGPSLRGDRSTPVSGPADFSQRKLEATRTTTSTASPSAIDGLAVEASHVAPEQRRDADARKHVRTALFSLGFRSAEADRALFVIDRKECDEPWRRPIETLVREALGILT